MADTQATPGLAAASLGQTLALLKTKNDTSRFVGLALLKSLLDNQDRLRDDPETIARCWTAISPTFLDRLLRASVSRKTSAEQAKDMRALAVAVIYAFTVLLPSDAEGQEKLVGRSAGLVAALPRSASNTTTQILQSLLTFASQPQGAAALWTLADLSPIVHMAPEEPLALQVIDYLVRDGATRVLMERTIRHSFDKIMSTLVASFKKGQSQQLLEYLAGLLPNIGPEMLLPFPSWLAPLTQRIRVLMSTRPTFAARRACTLLSASLLQLCPTTFPPLIFGTPLEKGSPDAPPFVYIFLNLNLIDIRATLPSLLELLNSPDYADISQRLSASYDIVSAFIGFLLHSLDDEDEDDDDRHHVTLNLSPDLLLKLRRDIAETLSLTIEYLRDRYDNAITGVAGLHPSARPSPDTVAPTGSVLSLPWDSTATEHRVTQDPLTLAELRTLSLWLRDDDNESLRKEAVGIMDVLMGLYRFSRDGKEQNMKQNGEGEGKGVTWGGSRADFRSPVLIALEGLLETEEGRSAFLQEDGWALLWGDAKSVLTPTFNLGATTLPTPTTRTTTTAANAANITSATSDPTNPITTRKKSPDTDDDIDEGIDILLILLDLVKLTAANSAPEAWVDVIGVASALAAVHLSSSENEEDKKERGKGEKYEEAEKRELEEKKNEKMGRRKATMQKTTYDLSIKVYEKLPINVRTPYRSIRHGILDALDLLLE